MRERHACARSPSTSARSWPPRCARAAGTTASPSMRDDVVLTTDPRRLERIVANLIGNALEHAGRDVSVRVGMDGLGAFVEVTDTGPGIPPDRLLHVFDRFYKADSSRAGAGQRPRARDRARERASLGRRPRRMERGRPRHPLHAPSPSGRGIEARRARVRGLADQPVRGDPGAAIVRHGGRRLKGWK